MHRDRPRGREGHRDPEAVPLSASPACGRHPCGGRRGPGRGSVKQADRTPTAVSPTWPLETDSVRPLTARGGARALRAGCADGQELPQTRWCPHRNTGPTVQLSCALRSRQEGLITVTHRAPVGLRSPGALGSRFNPGLPGDGLTREGRAGLPSLLGCPWRTFNGAAGRHPSLLPAQTWGPQPLGSPRPGPDKHAVSRSSLGLPRAGPSSGCPGAVLWAAAQFLTPSRGRPPQQRQAQPPQYAIFQWVGCSHAFSSSPQNLL